MSKIGRKPIPLSTAKVVIKDNLVSVEGPKGKLTHEFPDCLAITQKDGFLSVELKKNGRQNQMLWGLHRALLSNNVTGVE